MNGGLRTRTRPEQPARVTTRRAPNCQGYAAANTARVLAWQKANPDKCADRQRRRAALEAAAGTYSDQAWDQKLADYGGRCAYCADLATERDHVLPLCRGGSNTLDNVVPCCRQCNARKGTRTLAEWLAEKGLDPTGQTG